MKKIIALIIMSVFVFGNADAQGVLKRLKDKAVETVTNKAEEKVQKTVSDEMDDVLGNEDESKGKSKKGKKASDDDEETTNGPRKAEGSDVKNDFVPGTEVILADDFANEQMGEFPSKWDLIENSAEVARMNGKKAIKFEHGSDTEITPLVQNGNRKYLPEVYSLEFDYFITGEEDKNSAYRVFLKPEGDGDYTEIFIGNGDIAWNVLKPNSDDPVAGNAPLNGNHQLNDWNHFALSFNKRALKVYINGQRVINIPNAKAQDWFTIRTEFWEDHIDYITNVRLAKGGGELYGRDAQSMTAVEKAIAETGMFVTNNILFETGKATLKPESMAEIQKVADYMKKNSSVRFEVQGHTDNQGSDAVNDPLSQQRAEAVVKALEGLGVDGFNLRAVGKGSKEPIADNKTEEGRAKNRRVVFVKK